MRYSKEHNLAKVHYRPVEAAIRWSGLVRHERHIVNTLQGRSIFGPNDFPRWPGLRLNMERIHDAMINGELPYGVNGVTAQEGARIDDPRVTVRHVDLRSWMSRYYPDQRPAFLFSPIEQRLHPAITVDSVHALVVECDVLKSHIEHCDREIKILRSELRTKREAVARSDVSEAALGPRSETTYLHIVGGLLTLLLGRTPSGQPYSGFKTQESIISAMMAHHGERLGITERTLQAKFAAAKRKLSMD